METFLFTALILLALVLFAKLLQLKYLKLHTRERFAFYIVAAAMTLAWPFIYQLAPEIEFVFEVVTKWFSLVVKTDSRELDLKCLIVAFAVMVLLLVFMYLIYKNWGGQKNDGKEKDEIKKTNS